MPEGRELDMKFQYNENPAAPTSSSSLLEDVPVAGASERPISAFPDPMLELSQETKDKFIAWAKEWLISLINQQAAKQTEWAQLEKDYRAKNPGIKKFPFEGASNDVIPVIAMAIDPIHARLDTGVFKQDPVFRLKGLKKSVLKYVSPLESWVDFYQKHYLKLRSIVSPRILESCKLGTMVFKTVYDLEETEVLKYDNKWKVVKQKQTKYKGPRVYGIGLGDFIFPPAYQHLQDCPFIAERQRTTWGKLKVAAKSGKLVDKAVEHIKEQITQSRTELEDSREVAANHESSATQRLDNMVVYEVWCDYDINDDGYPEQLVATFHLETNTLLALRYNWYFHQKKPYTVIPYTITNDSLYGIGIGEMSKPFQDAITSWHRMASDNAYLANIRMFIVKKDAGIEEVPRLYAGRCFFVDDPTKDFVPFQAGNTYPTTISERQNLFGLVEKRTGVSDYLTGRESPIVGSRATASATMALIQEGTKRVEEVLENLRMGLAEILENCFYIWVQYGLGGMDDLVFGDDEIGALVKEFFDTIGKEEAINGCFAIDLTATDASGNRQIQQQMQLMVIQQMMMYLEKLLEAGQGALEAIRSQQPEYAEMVRDVMIASRKLFRDLLQKYDIRNPEDYLPQIEDYIDGQLAALQAGGGTPGADVTAGLPGMGIPAQASGGPQAPMPAAPGSGGQLGQQLA